MKNAPQDGAGRGAEQVDSDASVLVPFAITSLERVAFGSKRAVGTIEIPGLASELGFDYFEPSNRPTFVASRSIRCKFTGAYVRTVSLTAEFAAELLAAIERALEGTP